MAFDWTPACTTALVTLCNIITSEPVLVPPDQDRQFILEVDASQYATGAILISKKKLVLFLLIPFLPPK